MTAEADKPRLGLAAYVSKSKDEDGAGGDVEKRKTSPEDEDDAASTDAAERCMSALKSNDAKAFKSALREFVALVGTEG